MSNLTVQQLVDKYHKQLGMTKMKAKKLALDGLNSGLNLTQIEISWKLHVNGTISTQEAATFYGTTEDKVIDIIESIPEHEREEMGFITIKQGVLH